VRDLLAIAIKAMLTSNGLPEISQYAVLSKRQLMNLQVCTYQKAAPIWLPYIPQTLV
jgi:hypothetical protein